MAPKPINSTTEDLLRALLPPEGRTTTDITERAYAAVASVHDLVLSVQQHASIIDRLRRLADAAEESPEVFALFERIKQKCGALQRIAGEFSANADQLTDTLYQLDQASIKMKASIDTRDERL